MTPWQTLSAAKTYSDKYENKYLCWNCICCSWFIDENYGHFVKVMKSETIYYVRRFCCIHIQQIDLEILDDREVSCQQFNVNANRIMLLILVLTEFSSSEIDRTQCHKITWFWANSMNFENYIVYWWFILVLWIILDNFVDIYIFMVNYESSTWDNRSS